MKDHEIMKVQFALFSRNGFTSDMAAKSKNEGIRLFTVESIVNRVWLNHRCPPRISRFRLLYSI